MTTVSHQPSRLSQRWEWLELRQVWASLAITAMWLTVAVVSLFGPDIHSIDAGGTNSTVPSGIVLGFFALLGTIAVARYGLRERDRN
jgi:hypothetical protein